MPEDPKAPEGEKLNWWQATMVDQFVFSPIFNVTVFMWLSAYGGGLTLALPDFSADTLTLALSLTRSKFPAWNDSFMHMAQVKAWPIWLPAAVIRELYVPPHLAQAFVSCVAFIWAIVFAYIIG